MSRAGLIRAWGSPWLRLGLGALAFAAVTAVAVAIADLRISTGFAGYDDEGYMLVALDGFLDQGNLYDDVFSQYGPFYFEFWGAFFSVFGLSVDHDGGRTATTIAWVLAALLVGLATWRMTRSALLGLATQMLTFGAIGTLTSEPMHPGGLICLLLGLILAVACLVRGRSSPMAMGLLGGLVASLVLVKVNVGGFALAALALACVASFPFLRRWSPLRPAVEIAFIAIPLLVTAGSLDQAWARDYAIHVSVAAFCIVVALRARADGERDEEDLWWLLGGIVAVGVTVVVALLAAGTSPGGLLEGVIIQPLQQSDVFSIPLSLSPRVYLLDLLAVAGAISYWYLSRTRDRRATTGFTAATSLLGILIGFEIALSVIGRTLLFGLTGFEGYQFGLLAFAWVALAPAPGGEDSETGFARLLLPPLAVLQTLHAFPVAGSQVAWSTFLLVPVGALCVANGVRGLALVLGDERERRVTAAVGAAAAVLAVAVIADIQLRRPLDEAREAHDAAVPLDLPGAEEVRVSPPEAQLYRDLARTIDDYCASLVTLPGMNSFHFWSEREPATGFNATAWMKLLDEEQQRRVVEATRSVEGLCLLENDRLLEAWMHGEEPEGALVRSMRSGFEPLASFGDYTLLRRDDAAMRGS